MKCDYGPYCTKPHSLGWGFLSIIYYLSNMEKAIAKIPAVFDNTPLKEFITSFDEKQIVFYFPAGYTGIELSSEAIKENFDGVKMDRDYTPIHSWRTGEMVDCIMGGLTVTCLWKTKRNKRAWMRSNNYVVPE